MNFIIKLIINAIAVFILAYLLPGITINSYITALCIAIVLAFLNALVKPILIIFTLPITIFSFGLFLLIINGLIILFAEYIIDGFHVNSIWSAVLFSILLSILQSILQSFFKDSKK